MNSYDLTYLSLGAGVQSSALYVMSVLGLHGCPRASAAIFADTMAEPSWVYEQLDRLEEWGDGRIPIYRVSYGNLMQDVIDRHNGSRARVAAIPAFTIGDDGRSAILRRQCTREYKITPIEKKVKELLGYKKGQHVKRHAEALIGISLDEVTRVKPSRTKWVTNRYPLVDAGLRRSDCTELVIGHGLPRPKKSSCIFCPFHSNNFWKELKQQHPDEWDQAVEFDHAIRNMSMSGVKRPVYLHRSLVPLDEVDLGENQLDLWDNECSGVCGV